MIGTILENNDVWIYLTPEDITELGKGEVKGDYINYMENTLGTLTAKLNDDLQSMSNPGEITIDKACGKTKNLEVVIWTGKYNNLVKEGTTGVHLGGGKIDMNDIDRLKKSGQEKFIYDDLCFLIKRIEKNSK